MRNRTIGKRSNRHKAYSSRRNAHCRVRVILPYGTASAAGRFKKISKRLGVVGVLAHVAEHGKEIVGPHIPGQAADFARRRRLVGETARRFGKELESRCVANGVF